MFLINSANSFGAITPGYHQSFIMNGMYHVLAILDMNGNQG